MAVEMCVILVQITVINMSLFSKGNHEPTASSHLWANYVRCLEFLSLDAHLHSTSCYLCNLEHMPQFPLWEERG